MYRQILIVSLFATVINANIVGWRDCGSHLGTVYRVRIAGCTHTPCVFVRGQSYLIEVDASSRANTNNLPFVTSAMIFGIPIQLFQGNACDHLRIGHCPALVDMGFTFSLIFEVPTGLPPIPTVATTTLYNDYGDLGICVQVDLALA